MTECWGSSSGLLCICKWVAFCVLVTINKEWGLGLLITMYMYINGVLDDELNVQWNLMNKNILYHNFSYLYIIHRVQWIFITGKSFGLFFGDWCLWCKLSQFLLFSRSTFKKKPISVKIGTKHSRVKGEVIAKIPWQLMSQRGEWK